MMFHKKQTNPLSAELKFMIETQKPLTAAEISEMFIRQETVYGGLQGSIIIHKNPSNKIGIYV